MQILEMDLDDTKMQDFINLPWDLHGKTSKWVPPLKSTVKLRLSSANPFFQHTQVKAFLVMKENRAVARALASIDRNLAQPEGSKIGHIGFFESIDDQEVASALLTRTESWLKCQGTTEIQGPVDICIMFGYRFQTSGFDTEPFLGEPRNPPYYEKLWTTFGFERKSTWSSYDLKASDLTDARGAMEGFLQGDLPVAVEDFDLKNLDVELKEFYPVASESYSNNFGYSASNAEELDWLFRPLTGVFSQGTFCKARNKEGRVVGFAFGYWDLAPAFIEINGDDQKASLLNEFVPKRFLIHTIAMAKSYQKTVATYQVMYQLMKYVIAAGTPAVGCLTKEGGRTVYDKAGAATRTYSVYAKTLS